MPSTPADTISGPNPRRSDVVALVQRMASEPGEDLGIYGTSAGYDPAAVLARVPGDDLRSIVANGTRDAALSATRGRRAALLALLLWLTGLLCLFGFDTLLAAVVLLAAGTLGLWRAVRMIGRANQTMRLMTALRGALASN